VDSVGGLCVPRLGNLHRRIVLLGASPGQTKLGG
jgi:hypothetical protein